MNKKLDDTVLGKAWEKEDSPSREEARKEVLAYLNRKLENANAMVAGLKEDVEQIEALIKEEDETENSMCLADEKWLTDLYRIQWELVLELLEGINAGYQKKWGYEPATEVVEKEKIIYLLESVMCLERFIESIEQEAKNLKFI